MKSKDKPKPKQNSVRNNRGAVLLIIMKKSKTLCHDPFSVRLEDRASSKKKKKIREIMN